jgi:hypothetical protein
MLSRKAGRPRKFSSQRYHTEFELSNLKLSTTLWVNSTILAPCNAAYLQLKSLYLAYNFAILYSMLSTFTNLWGRSIRPVCLYKWTTLSCSGYWLYYCSTGWWTCRRSYMEAPSKQSWRCYCPRVPCTSYDSRRSIDTNRPFLVWLGSRRSRIPDCG